MPKTLNESRPLVVTEATADTSKSGRLKIGLITPGWGSSGYYSEKVLENAADAKVFPAGTQMFLDHPGENEMYDRPERSVRDLAAVLTEDAVWDPTTKALVGEAQVFGPFVDMLTDEHLAEAIGVSIRAAAEVTTGEAEGRKGRIITELVEGISADFVTKAGRGGSILAVLESARPALVNERAQARGVSEATANDTREALQTALRDAYPGEKSWVWVRDFDESTVWYEHETPDQSGTFAEGYQLDTAGAVTLAGDRVEVRARTEYVPINQPTATEGGARSVPAPAGQSTATESEETNMATTQIEESRLAQLEKDSERVQSLESERDTAVAERDELLVEARKGAAARVIAAESHDAGVSFTQLEQAGLMAALPVNESGRLDEEKFAAAVKEAAATKAQESGAGRVTGFGSTIPSGGQELTEADVDKAVAGAFGRDIKEA